MTRRSIAYQPALDGMRALAVTAVLFFHGGVSWMTGGYLGVSMFFTLSGFLITTLLLKEHSGSGRIDARGFYSRRAKRLLPASLVCLLAVTLLAAAGRFRGVANLRRDVLAALLQVYNWAQLRQGESYADVTQAAAGFKNPLDHYWSLAIEEQFYWIWPVLFMGLLVLARRWNRYPIVLVGGLTLAGAVAAPLIAVVWGPDAAYFATPARIDEILMGALAACWVFGRTLRPELRHAALPALAVLTVLCVVLPAFGGPAYEGALPLVAVVSAALILGLQVAGPARRVLAIAPLVALGRISYGVYLFHWPVFVLIDRYRWDVPVGVSLSIKVAITLVVATASYFLIEKPVRTSEWFVPGRTLVGALAGTAIVAAAITLMPVTTKYYGVDQVAAAAAAIDPAAGVALQPLSTTTTASADAATTPVPPGSSAPASTTIPATTTTVPLVPPRPVRIVVIGDSTSEAVGAGLVTWAAANPAMAQVSVESGAGCGMALGGIRIDGTSDYDIDAHCTLYVEGIVPERIAALRPDVVMILTTTWDVADRRLVAGGPILTVADPQAKAAISASFQRLTDQLFDLGVSRVVWVREPVPIPGMLGPVDRQGDPARHQVLYSLMDDMAAANPAVRVADLAGWVEAQGLTLDVPSRPDAVHWTSDAAARMAREFLGPLLVREALT